jgi:hypothetical protein
VVRRDLGCCPAAPVKDTPPLPLLLPLMLLPLLLRLRLREGEMSALEVLLPLCASSFTSPVCNLTHQHTHRSANSMCSLDMAA